MSQHLCKGDVDRLTVVNIPDFPMLVGLAQLLGQCYEIVSRQVDIAPGHSVVLQWVVRCVLNLPFYPLIAERIIL